MTSTDSNALIDQLVSLGAAPVDARALAPLAGPQPDPDLAELVLRVLGALSVSVIWRIVTAWLPDIERALPDAAPGVEALRGVVSPATTERERRKLAVEAMMRLYPEDGSGPSDAEGPGVVGSAVFVLAQSSPDRASHRVVSEAVSNLLGVVMKRDPEAGQRCLRALWTLAAAGVSEAPKGAQ